MPARPVQDAQPRQVDYRQAPKRRGHPAPSSFHHEPLPNKTLKLTKISLRSTFAA